MKKKLLTRLGKIETPKQHILCAGSGQFNISYLMTETLCYMGQSKVFAEGAETIQRLTGVDVSDKQIERVSHHYGELLEQKWKQQIKEEGARMSTDADRKPHYLMVDASLVLTRKDRWKEIKLCRMFPADDRIEVSKNRPCITTSRYVAHLGKHKEFLEKVEYHADALTDKIIVADGAPWIWRWADESYPEAAQVLDFFHVKEHLCAFAELQFKEDNDRKKWIDTQCLRLLNDQVSTVIEHIKALKPSSKEARESRKKLIQYYTVNRKRMLYRTYRDKGWAIGSGAIEAAHRHVIQQRVKLSGQRWTIPGVQQVANLRVAHKSNEWDSVLNLILKAA